MSVGRVEREVEEEVVGRRGGGEGVAVEIGEEVMGGGAELLVSSESFNFLFLRLPKENLNLGGKEAVS